MRSCIHGRRRWRQHYLLSDNSSSSGSVVMKGKHDHQLMRERNEFTWQYAAEEGLELIGDRGEVDDELDVLELG